MLVATAFMSSRNSSEGKVAHYLEISLYAKNIIVAYQSSKTVDYRLTREDLSSLEVDHRQTA